MAGMDIKNNILETIGNTPLIRLNKVTRDLALPRPGKSGIF
jgi:cysteine synthase